jgi:ABC-type Fe3+-hydroxamate transport system substrate-binding protein
VSGVRRRVVSLVPSVTETLAAWGRPPIACTRFCERPDLPHVGGTKDPDVAAIVGLRPDLVVLDEEENRREDADALAAAGVALHITAVRSLADVAPTLAGLAGALGLPPPSLNAEPPLERLDGQRTVSAFVPIWRRPWMTINAATYGSTLLAAAGVRNVYAGDEDRYPTIGDLADATARKPDVVLAPSEPYPFGERHRAELQMVAPVVFVDGRDLFWWGARTPGALSRIMARRLGDRADGGRRAPTPT